MNFFGANYLYTRLQPSGGSVQLSSNDPFAAPIIDPAFLKEPFDLAVMREAVKQAKLFFTAPAWNDYVIGLTGPLASATTDDEIDQVIKDNSSTVWHLVGTAMMSSASASWGVVNPDFRVKGVQGLRVVDGSVLVSDPFPFTSCCSLMKNFQKPFIPSAHTQAPIYAFAERASDVIKSAWKL